MIKLFISILIWGAIIYFALSLFVPESVLSSNVSGIVSSILNKLGLQK